MIVHQTSTTMEIHPIEKHQVEAVRTIIIDAVLELNIIPNLNKIELLATGELDDLDHIESVYTHKRGVFLVITENGTVIGMGALKYFDEQTCELRRMFFKKEYRGKGLGSHMLAILLEHAKKLRYTKIRLDVYNPSTQGSAIKLYKKFGFYEIEAYKACRAKLFMEKTL